MTRAAYLNEQSTVRNVFTVKSTKLMAQENESNKFNVWICKYNPQPGIYIRSTPSNIESMINKASYRQDRPLVEGIHCDVIVSIYLKSISMVYI